MDRIFALPSLEWKEDQEDADDAKQWEDDWDDEEVDDDFSKQLRCASAHSYTTASLGSDSDIWRFICRAELEKQTTAMQTS